MCSLAPSSKPFFTIITCTFNSETFLSDNIKSVEGQSFSNFEHIFIDAYSTDRTVQLIEAYQARCPGRVRLYQLPPKGISNAMNAGIERARGEVISHLHGDDYLYSSETLRNVNELFVSSNASLVIGNCMLMSKNGISYTWPRGRFKRSLVKKLFRALMFYMNMIPHPSTYIRSNVFVKYGQFDENIRVVMDYEFWFRVLRRERLYLLDHVLSVYRFHQDTVSTRQMAAGLVEVEQIRNKYKLEYRFDYFFFRIFLRPVLALRRLLKCKLSSLTTMFK